QGKFKINLAQETVKNENHKNTECDMSFKFFHKMKTTISLFVCLLSFNIPIYADQNEEEEYFLPSFRSGHNLSLFLSGENTTWNASQTTPPATSDGIIDSAQQTKIVMSVFFRYAYHVNIISSFGFFV